MINAEELEKTGISYRDGLERFMDDEELYEAVLNAFINDDLLSYAQKAIKENDKDSLFKAIHGAKGTCGNAGFNNLYIEAESLLKLVKGGQDITDAMQKAFTNFEAEYLRIAEGVKRAVS